MLIEEGGEPYSQFGALLEGLFRDLKMRNTTMFFSALRSLANHGAAARDTVQF
ncbi:MAG: hypothetical protein ACJA2J_000320 [Candidatus Azotimanducaceae bacterium]|jgi:hypothetical protein